MITENCTALNVPLSADCLPGVETPVAQLGKDLYLQTVSLE
jgi:hypothetical protein